MQVAISEAGETLLASFFGQHVRGIVAEMSALTPEEQDEPGRLCRGLDLRDSSSGQTSAGDPAQTTPPQG